MSFRTLKLVNIPCPLCGGTENMPWAEENGYHAVKCADCGLVYVNPRPSGDAIQEANMLGQHRTADGVMDVVYKPSRRKILHYGRIVRKLFRNEIASGKPVQWLDIGAGYGEFVESVAQSFPAGSVVEGIDPMLAKVTHAQARGLAITTKSIAEIDKKYDVISLINVFAHIPDFESFLAETRSVLKDDGCIFLETGNGSDLARRSQYPDELFLPDHLVFGGVDHVKGFLVRGGFSRIKTYEIRRDTLMWSAKSLVKKMIGRPAKLCLPYVSPFRSVFFKAAI